MSLRKTTNTMRTLLVRTSLLTTHLSPDGLRIRDVSAPFKVVLPFELVLQDVGFRLGPACRRQASRQSRVGVWPQVEAANGWALRAMVCIFAFCCLNAFFRPVLLEGRIDQAYDGVSRSGCIFGFSGFAVP